jgi:hypothetical protein
MEEYCFDLSTDLKEYRRKLWKDEIDAQTHFTSTWKNYPLFVSRYVIGNMLFAFVVFGWMFIWFLPPFDPSLERVPIRPLLIFVWMTICSLFLIKWLTGYYNCTYGYMECRQRKCKREDGFINNFVDRVYTLMDASSPYAIIFFMIFSFAINCSPS